MPVAIELDISCCQLTSELETVGMKPQGRVGLRMADAWRVNESHVLACTAARLSSSHLNSGTGAPVRLAILPRSAEMKPCAFLQIAELGFRGCDGMTETY